MRMQASAALRRPALGRGGSGRGTLPGVLHQAPDGAGTVPPAAGIGHNAGPRLDHGFVGYCWRRAHAAAWKTPPREVVLRRLERARALGMTYREYTAIILDRGVHL